MESTFPSRLRLLSTGFRYADTRLFIGRADLYFDRVELFGLGAGRSGKRIITLASIERVEFAQPDDGRNATSFHLVGGERIDVHLGKPQMWKRRLTSRLDWNARLESTMTVSRDASEWTLGDIVNYSTSMS